MRIDLLDQGWLELQQVMGTDQDIVNAARVSFLGDSKGEVADKKLLFYLMEHQHTSPFEMVEFKFRLRAPLLTLWQLVRHRTANINMQSGRYTPFEENDFYTPQADEWRLQSKSNKQGSDGFLDPFHGQHLTAVLKNLYESCYKFYRMALDNGVSKEMARLFLPGFSVYYTCVWKIDAHNLMHFLRLRLSDEAQYEIRVYAQALYEIFKKQLPWTAEAFEKYQLPPASPTITQTQLMSPISIQDYVEQQKQLWQGFADLGLGPSWVMPIPTPKPATEEDLKKSWELWKSSVEIDPDPAPYGFAGKTEESEKED